MIDFQLEYGRPSYWLSLLILCAAFAAFRTTDNWAVRRHWGLWARAGLKAPVLVGFELFNSSITAQTCDSALKGCHGMFMH